MSIRPDDAAILAKEIRAVFADAEILLLQKLAQALANGVDEPTWAQDKLLATQTVRQQIDRIIRDLENAAPGAVERAMGLAYNRGIATAAGELTQAGLTAGAFEVVQATGAVAAFATDTLERVTPMSFLIRRAVMDIYQQVTTQAASMVAAGVLTRRQASASLLQKLAQNGVTGFRDKSGRNWSMPSYAEMAVRSSTASAMLQGHTDRIREVGMDLVQVSDAPENCSICAPYEGRVLSLSGARVGEKLSDGAVVLDSLAGARQAGLYHPNAILGDHQFASIGNIENAVRAWYDGPSIELHTARGVRLTVSPNHPVLTARGWVAAERLNEGDQLFHAGGVGGSFDGSKVGDELDNVVSGVADKFEALRSVSPGFRLPASGDDLHGDGKFCEGEIDVVVTDPRLLANTQSELFEQCEHNMLVGANVGSLNLTGDSSFDFGILGVLGPVTGALADGHASGFESTKKGRVADSENVGEVLAGLPFGVEADELVSVNRVAFQGWAYDFQTSFGGYMLNSILVHNCRHSHSIYLPGITKQVVDTDDPEAYALRQKQRAFERRVRELKREDAIAQEFGGTEAVKARAKLRAKQAEFKTWREDNGRKNLAYRESIKSR